MAEHTIVVDNAGATFLAASGEIILDAALRQGIALPHQCRGASCGTCKARLLEGEVDHGWNFGLALTDEEKAQGYCLLCQSRPLSTRLRVCTVNAMPSGSSMPRRVETQVVALARESHNVCRLTLALPSGADFEARPGGYAELVLPGVSPHRTYSFAGVAMAGLVSFYVSRHPHGKASGYVHEQLRVGDKMGIVGPFGQFALPPDADAPVLALAGGTGLAPILALAQATMERENPASFEILLSLREPAELFALDRLLELERRSAGRLRYRVAYSRAQADGVAALSGRLPALLPALYPSLDAYRVLIAGSPSFVDACASVARQLGVGQGNLALDRFTAAVGS